MSEAPVDILVRAANGEGLDQTVRTLPGCQAAVVGGPIGPFTMVDDAFVVRCFSGAPFLKLAIDQQGYGTVLRELEELV